MKKRSVDVSKLVSFYEKKLEEPAVEKPVVFEQQIYHDKKQYSCKLSSKMFKYVEYKKGDKLRFTIIPSGKDNYEIKVEYVK